MVRRAGSVVESRLGTGGCKLSRVAHPVARSCYPSVHMRDVSHETNIPVADSKRHRHVVTLPHPPLKACRKAVVLPTEPKVEDETGGGKVQALFCPLHLQLRRYGVAPGIRPWCLTGGR